jgi:hypothetical protein
MKLIKRKSARTPADPVHSLIAKHRALSERHNRALKNADRSNSKKLDWLATKACRAECIAERKLLSTPPTTVAGLSALLKYIEEQKDAGDDMLMVYMTDVRRNPRPIGVDVVFRTLIKSMELLASQR